MVRASIDDVSPQEWDAYNKRHIQSLKDSNNYNKKGLTDQESIDALDNKMETDMLESYSRKPDNVNSPRHYNSGAVECIDAIEAMLNTDEYIGYLRGNSMKYRWRMRYKGKAIEDLQKAGWYENRLINYLKENKIVLGQKG